MLAYNNWQSSMTHTYCFLCAVDNAQYNWGKSCPYNIRAQGVYPTWATLLIGESNFCSKNHFMQWKKIVLQLKRSPAHSHTHTHTDNEAQVATKDKLSVSRLIMLLLACWWDCLMKYECNMRRGQWLYWNQTPKESGPKSMHACTRTHTHAHARTHTQREIP